MKKKSASSASIKIGDKVWWYHPEAILEVINVNATHAHLRNIHGALSWEPLEKLKKIVETESAQSVARVRAEKRGSEKNVIKRDLP